MTQGKRMNNLGDRPPRLTSTNSGKKQAFSLILDKRIVAKTPRFNEIQFHAFALHNDRCCSKPE
jgi:hypothetical protein